MLINSQTHNYLMNMHNIHKGYPISVQYQFTNSLFDKALGELEWLKLLDKQEIETLELAYGNSIISYPIHFNPEKLSLVDHTHQQLLLFHIHTYPMLKVEDIAILSNNLNKYTKISFSPTISKWPLSNLINMQYGIPYLPVPMSQQPKKSILILNLNNNSTTTSVHRLLQKSFDDIDILSHSSLSLAEMYQLMSKYKICIDLDNYYNLLIAGYCGAYGIGIGQSYDSHIATVQTPQQILDIVPQVLGRYKPEAMEQIKVMIAEKYDFNKFSRAFKTHMINITLENVGI